MSKSQTTTTTRDDKVAMDELLAMFTYCRPHGSKSEKRFIRSFIKPLGVETDRIGNLFKRIGASPIIWSCHTDTVSGRGGVQTVQKDGDTIKLFDTQFSDCLGGDDTAGVWLMREMILAKIPGIYIFHRGEEKGCIGSSYIAQNAKDTHKAVFDGIQFAIAFDRKGKSDIITHQRGARCCSNEFADSFNDALGGGFTKEHGVYTDTASYTNEIGECTNISVGYCNAHSAAETQDAKFLFELREKLLAMDTSKLVSKRKPGEKEHYYYGDYGHGYGGYYGRNSGWGWLKNKFKRDAAQEKEDARAVDAAISTEPAPWKGAQRAFDLTSQGDQISNVQSLEQACKLYPAEVADFLEHHGVSLEEIATHIIESRGRYYGDGW